MVCRAIFHLCGALVDIIHDEIIPNFNMVGLLAAGLEPIIHEQHGALVVLKNDVIRHIKHLCTQK